MSDSYKSNLMTSVCRKIMVWAARTYYQPNLIINRPNVVVK